MKMKKLFLQELQGTRNITKYGYVSSEIAMEVKMATSTYEYIEIVNNHYCEDDAEHLEWTDVEGFGYGWLWCGHDKSKWHGRLSKEVEAELERILSSEGEGYVIASEDEDSRTYHFIVLRGNREDIIITLSHKELFF